jgi:hypothetical protein
MSATSPGVTVDHRIRVTMAYNPTYLGTQVTLDVLYGVAEGRDASGITVLS